MFAKKMYIKVKHAKNPSLLSRIIFQTYMLYMKMLKQEKREPQKTSSSPETETKNLNWLRKVDEMRYMKRGSLRWLTNKTSSSFFSKLPYYVDGWAESGWTQRLVWICEKVSGKYIPWIKAFIFWLFCLLNCINFFAVS